MSLSTLQRSRSRHISRACFETLEDRRLLSFSPAASYPGGANPQEVVTGDFNGDGHLDVATLNLVDGIPYTRGTVSVLPGNGAGGFGAAINSDVGANFYTNGDFYLAWLSLTVADFDNDGDLDLAMAITVQNTVAGEFSAARGVCLGHGDGTFGAVTHIPANDAVDSVAAGDFNNDGNSDLVVTGYSNPFGESFLYAQVLLGNGQGGFASLPYLGLFEGNCYELVVGDFNGDGNLDAVGMAGQHDQWGIVLLGNGGTSSGFLDYYPFSTTSVRSTGIAVGDFTGDGIPDLVVSGDAYSPLDAGVELFTTHGGGMLGQPTFNSANGYVHTDVAVADFNGDGKLDAVTSDADTGTVSELPGNGNGTLTYAGAYAVGLSPSAIAVGDFNGDGRSDVATANAGSNTVSVLLNDGDWTPPPPPPPPPPALRIGDRTVTEGNTGTASASFTVTLSAPSTQPVTVAYATGNGTATAGSDYQAASGTLTFAPGETSKALTVLVNGDRSSEPNETFVVNLSSPTNAVIADGQGVGTILDDDVPPAIIISNVSRAEGDSGTTPFTFTVSLTTPSDQAVSVNYATAANSATSSGGNRDFFSASGTLVFPAGVTSKTVTVSVVGDTRVESDETFFVNLTQPVNATLADAQGVGTILNDDSGRGKKWVGATSGGSWSTAGNWDPSGVPTGDSLVTISDAAVSLGSSATVSELSLGAGAALAVAPSGGRVLRTAGLFLDGGAKLNLNDNDLIVDQGNFAAIRALVLQGFGAGATTGITSSTSDGTQILALFDNALVGATQWQGQSIPNTAIVGKYTFFGDLNFDGQVTGDDYTVIDSNLNTTPSSSVAWISGDANLDGIVTGDDYTTIDSNLGLGVGNPLIFSTLLKDREE